jgi:hypothetical protein
MKKHTEIPEGQAPVFALNVKPEERDGKMWLVARITVAFDKSLEDTFDSDGFEIGTLNPAIASNIPGTFEKWTAFITELGGLMTEAALEHVSGEKPAPASTIVVDATAELKDHMKRQRAHESN